MTTEMSDHDYEALPEDVSPQVHMLAGGAAGILEHIAMYPLDVVKTRVQTSPKFQGMADCMKTMARTEGVGSFFKGIRPVIAGAGPAHALYFSVYERSRLYFDAKHNQVLGNTGAAVCATFAHDSFMNPIEVVKQRLQVANTPYKSALDCVYKVAANEGPLAFYRSFGTSLIMNAPFHSVYLVLYNTSREYLNPEGLYSPATHLVAGGLAGGIAAGVTTPLDNCKTLLNTQEQCVGAKSATEAVTHNRTFPGLLYAIRSIHHQHGWKGFLRGWSARMLLTAPAGAISWSVYEFFKHFLHIAESDGGEEAGTAMSDLVHQVKPQLAHASSDS
eukprot:TRINITY_DN8519_c0_g1_i1.p1 TRINITY_DN8519_c0_g1~~TRINITY_DN8519_c0_g1_i1.p1  ORF type:complete len:331 (+),score=43.06 TRINITY_DN8519_c0_g1_i1:349-1341(+)